jgi:hypothetical protein
MVLGSKLLGTYLLGLCRPERYDDDQTSSYKEDGSEISPSILMLEIEGGGFQ